MTTEGLPLLHVLSRDLQAEHSGTHRYGGSNQTLQLEGLHKIVETLVLLPDQTRRRHAHDSGLRHRLGRHSKEASVRSIGDEGLGAPNHESIPLADCGGTDGSYIRPRIRLSHR